MNEIQLSFSPYELKLIKSFRMAGKEIKSRKGFIIKLKSSGGAIGIGDCCPFPEIGSETFEQAEKLLADLKLEIKIKLQDLQKSLKNTLNDFTRFPSLRHGIEQALLNLICKEKQATISDLLKIKFNNAINVNATIGILSLGDTISLIKKFLAEGFETIKLKCGRDNFDEELKIIKAIRTNFNKDLKLRIDVNAKWNIEQALLYLKKLHEFNLEYVEQPVNNLDEFLQLKKIGVKLAADESVRNFEDAQKIINTKCADVLILKPMIIGGLLPTLEIIDIAKRNNVGCVVTSSFESSIGKANAVAAAAYTGNNFAHGLGVQNLFEKDLVEDKFKVQSGKIILR